MKVFPTQDLTLEVEQNQNDGGGGGDDGEAAGPEAAAAPVAWGVSSNATGARTPPPRALPPLRKGMGTRRASEPRLGLGLRRDSAVKFAAGGRTRTRTRSEEVPGQSRNLRRFGQQGFLRGSSMHLTSSWCKGVWRSTRRRSRELGMYVLKHGLFSFVMMVATIYALFGDDSRVLLFSKSSDQTFEYLSSAAFFLFSSELLLR